MTTTVVLNLIDATPVVGALAWVCRTAYRVAGGLLDGGHRPVEQTEIREEPERLAA